MTLSRTVAVTILCAAMTGCGMLGSKKCDCTRDDKGAPPAEEKVKIDPKSGLPRQRVILNEGYSELYKDVTSLDRSEIILAIKTEADAVDEIVTGVSKYAEHVKNELERLAGEYPALKIDMDPLPEMEKRKRHDLAMSRAKEYAPIVGKSGVEYERRVLMSLHGGLAHQEHMCKVLAEEEPEPGLKKFLVDTQNHFAAWRERVQVVLERDYFRQPPKKR